MRRFGGQVDRVLRNLDGQVLLTNDHLARQARLWLQAPGLVEHVFLEFVGFFERIEAFTHDAVAGGAGTHAATALSISMW